MSGRGMDIWDEFSKTLDLEILSGDSIQIQKIHERAKLHEGTKMYDDIFETILNRGSFLHWIKKNIKTEKKNTIRKVNKKKVTPGKNSR